MGQYHKTVNLTKREFIDPYAFGDGLKLLEQGGYGCPGGINDALHLLLAVSNGPNGRGGGDVRLPPDYRGPNPIGRWGGDRIAVVGDYAEPGDLHDPNSEYVVDPYPELDASDIYSLCSPEKYQDEICAQYAKDEDKPNINRDMFFDDISEDVIPVLRHAYEVIYVGEGWRTRMRLSEIVEGWEYSHLYTPGRNYHESYRVAEIEGVGRYSVDLLLFEVASYIEEEILPSYRHPIHWRREGNKINIPRDLGLSPQKEDDDG